MTKVILGSGSPSRLELLRRAGLDPIVQVSGASEEALPGETPIALASRLAQAKAAAVAATVDDGLVIGCDSLLEFDGIAHGKPGTPAVALELWRKIGGRRGLFHTGHCVIDATTGRSVSAVGSTTVHFAKLTSEEIAAYVDTSEPLAVAGAFKIDRRGGWFVDRIEGDHSNLQGLSLPLLRRLLAKLNVSVPQLWN